MNTAADIIHRTKALFKQPNSWCQWQSLNEPDLAQPNRPTQRCLSFALFCAFNQLGYPDAAKREAYETAKRAVMDACGGDIIRFNDGAGRTEADVHCALDQAAVTIRQGQVLPARPVSLEQTSAS